MMRSKLLFLSVMTLLCAAWLIPAVSASGDDDDKEIKIYLKTPVKHGDAPLPVNFVVEIEADEELDEYIYKSSQEWRIEGSFVLTSAYTGGNPASDPIMRRDPVTSGEMMVRGNKHLVARERKRAPRKKFDPVETEVKRVLDWQYTFDKAGTYYITFSLRNGKYTSNQLRIEVRGDTSYDPYRDPY